MLCLKRWVCEEHPEVQTALGGLVHNYDRDDYESMAGVVDVYNKAVRWQPFNPVFGTERLSLSSKIMVDPFPGEAAA